MGAFILIAKDLGLNIAQFKTSNILLSVIFTDKFALEQDINTLILLTRNEEGWRGKLSPFDG